MWNESRRGSFGIYFTDIDLLDIDKASRWSHRRTGSRVAHCAPHIRETYCTVCGWASPSPMPVIFDPLTCYL